ncbi:hypothetical protein N7461_003004 [Penicillium sp. DV-2018c]|nr:hypothetical protein N7461_003004 [Penicillium sp. DV-2018c]
MALDFCSGVAREILSVTNVRPSCSTFARYVVAKKRQNIDEVKCLAMLQSEQIIHNSQEWLCKLLVGNPGFHTILLNWLPRRIQMMPDGMDCQWQAFEVFQDPDNFGFLFRCEIPSVNEFGCINCTPECGMRCDPA